MIFFILKKWNRNNNKKTTLLLFIFAIIYEEKFLLPFHYYTMHVNFRIKKAYEFKDQQKKFKLENVQKFYELI